MATRRTVKTGVALPAELAKRFDELLRELGIPSRSRGIQEAIRNFIAANEWRLNRGEVVGAVFVLYSHESEEAEVAITDAQHEHMEIIPAAMHVHVSREDCLLIIGVRGSVLKVKELSSKLRGVKGVKQVVPVVISPQ
uniref:Putative nickel-responsive regulator n=1 Tax=Fervidicoccus fontis TaxID=683846 RepID=A0A7J3ZLJ5_9CREN